MLDLRAKLLAAGLVTEEQAARVDKEEEQKRARSKSKGPRHRKGRQTGSSEGTSDADRWRERIAKLKNASKSEQYDVVRGWVVRTRLDLVKAAPTENAQRFHFRKSEGGIGWLTLEPEISTKLREGTAGIIAFMSHNGLSHCVVPADVARDVHEIQPEWVRCLRGTTHTDSPETDSPETDSPETDSPETDSPITDSPRTGSSEANPD